MKVVFYPSDFTACSWQRAWFPGYWMRKLGLAEVQFAYGADPAVKEWGDCFVYQRHYDPKQVWAWWKELEGKRRVYEIDDDVFAMPKSNPFHRCFTPEVLWAMKDMIRTADLVICSTDGLAESMSRFNKKTAVVPNGIDPQVFDLPVNRDPDAVKILFCGSRTHDEDFAIAKPALKRVMERHAKVELHFVGDPPTGALEFFPDKQTYRHGWIQFEELYPYLAKLGPDIIIAPLTKHPFNQGKSCIKFLEAAALGAVCMASPVSDFKKYLRTGFHGFLCEKESHWEENLEWLIEYPDNRRILAGKAKEFVRATFAYDVLAPQWASVLEESHERGSTRHSH